VSIIHLRWKTVRSGQPHFNNSSVATVVRLFLKLMHTWILISPGFSRNSTLLTCNLHWCKVPDICLGCWHFDRPNPQFLKFAPVLGEIGIGRLDQMHNCFPCNQNPAIPEKKLIIQFKSFSVRWDGVIFWNSCIYHQFFQQNA
jgi:hypothetical protein